jgi:hypothetical protein
VTTCDDMFSVQNGRPHLSGCVQVVVQVVSCRCAGTGAAQLPLQSSAMGPVSIYFMGGGGEDKIC